MGLLETFDKKIEERDVVKNTIKKLNEAEKINQLVEAEKKFGQEMFASGNVSIYDMLMDKHYEQIERISILSFSKDSQEMAMEKTVGFIEQNFNIKSIRTNIKRDMWIEMDGIMIPNAESYIKEIIRVIFKDNFRPYIVNNIIVKIEADSMVEMESFFEEKNKHLIALQNGIYNIEEKSFIEYKYNKDNPTFFSKIKTIYKPTAKCPNFIKHLETILTSQKDIDQIQEFFGYCLLRDYPIAKVFLWIGDGSNGKTITSNVLSKMLGETKNIANISLGSLESYPFSMAQLQGKHANIIGELEQKKIESTEKLKTATGNDPIEAPRKNTSFIIFKNYAKFLILGNELFPTRDMTPAFFRRISMIDFKFRFVSKYDFERLTKEELELGIYKLGVSDIGNKLSDKKEIEGVLQWAIEGLHRVLDNKEFTVSRTTEETKQKYLRKSNNMTAFIEELIDLKYDMYIEKKKFRYIYNIYCRKYEINPTNDKRIFTTLSDFGAQTAQKNNINTMGNIKVWDGISFKKKHYDELIEWGLANGFAKPIETKREGLVIEQKTAKEFLAGGN